MAESSFAPTGVQPDPADREGSPRARRVMEAASDGTDIAADDLNGRDLIAQVASEKGEPVGPVGQQRALDWFLTDEDDDITKTLRLNVGGPVDEDGVAIDARKPPVWIEWVIRPVDLDEIKRIRRQSQDPKSRRQQRMRGQGETDDNQFNLGLVVTATIEPDLAQAAQSMKGPDGQRGVADARLAVKWRFRNRSGLIGQIVGEILDFSGFNDNDVQDAVEVTAAGNS
jgi:hypothetical protein